MQRVEERWWWWILTFVAVETSDKIPFFMHEAWYSDNIEFLSMPVDSFDECSGGIFRLISLSLRWFGTDASDSSFSISPAAFGILVGQRVFDLLDCLLVGLILSCGLIQGSAITPALPVRFAGQWLLVRMYMKDEMQRAVQINTEVSC